MLCDVPLLEAEGRLCTKAPYPKSWEEFKTDKKDFSQFCNTERKANENDKIISLKQTSTETCVEQNSPITVFHFKRDESEVAFYKLC